MPALQRVSYSVVVVLAAAVGAGVIAAHAQDSYPNKPVRIVTGGAGSQTDMLVRLIGHELSERWSQAVVIENRTGAGGAMAVPDGHTLLQTRQDRIVRADIETYTKVAKRVGLRAK